MKKKHKKSPKGFQEIRDYDSLDTSGMIDPAKVLRFEDLGLKLPPTPPTQVISIRLPSQLLNEIRAIGSEEDIPYQALIKYFLAQAVSSSRRGRGLPK